MSHKLIESLGLKVKRVLVQETNGLQSATGMVDVVFASDLETLLEKGQKVYGWANNDCYRCFSDKGAGTTTETHEGLLIGIREIKKEAVKLQWHETVDDVCGAGPLYNGSLEALRGKRVRVTVEEFESEPS